MRILIILGFVVFLIVGFAIYVNNVSDKIIAQPPTQDEIREAYNIEKTYPNRQVIPDPYKTPEEYCIRYPQRCKGFSK